mmetsp:Transcript_22748/g.71400  ORF Transcript_22748/g.71400 Transcript_22748/m.71400 type:complete len:288 (+) Transcript_22748:530-1393(+)
MAASRSRSEPKPKARTSSLRPKCCSYLAGSADASSRAPAAPTAHADSRAHASERIVPLRRSKEGVTPRVSSPSQGEAWPSDQPSGSSGGAVSTQSSTRSMRRELLLKESDRAAASRWSRPVVSQSRRRKSGLPSSVLLWYLRTIAPASAGSAAWTIPNPIPLPDESTGTCTVPSLSRRCSLSAGHATVAGRLPTKTLLVPAASASAVSSLTRTREPRSSTPPARLRRAAAAASGVASSTTPKPRGRPRLSSGTCKCSNSPNAENRLDRSRQPASAGRLPTYTRRPGR